MMTLSQIVSEIRLTTGATDARAVSRDDLLRRFHSQLEWLASELEYRVETDEHAVALTAGTGEYPLPSDLGQLLWVRWNEKYLQPSSLHEWTREERNWQDGDSGTPSEYAVQNRRLLLYPAPDSSAVTTDGELSLSYIATAGSAGESGIPQLSDADLWVAIYATADAWLGLHPSRENEARRATCQQEIGKRLPAAKKRHQQHTRGLNPAFRFGGRGFNRAAR